MTPVPCVQCGEDYIPHRDNQKYCSKKCRRKETAMRKKEDKK